MNGEGSMGGRALAHLVDGISGGTTWELPLMAKVAWKNRVANPYLPDKAMGLALTIPAAVSPGKEVRCLRRSTV